jgi:hypothetical protein
MKIKLNKIIRILLGIDFLLILLSVIFKGLINFRQIHPILGIILLLLGTIHILLQHFIKKKK